MTEFVNVSVSMHVCKHSMYVCVYVGESVCMSGVCLFVCACLCVGVCECVSV